MENVELFGRSFTPEQVRKGVMILGGLMMAYLLYSWTWPQIQAYMDLESQIQQKQERLTQVQSGLRSKPELLAAIKRDRLQIAQLRDRIPSRKEVLAVLLVDLNRMFDQTGNRLVGFSPTGFKGLGKQGDLSDIGAITINIHAVGTYPHAIRLFDDLSRYQNILTIDDPTFSPASDQGSDYQLDYTFDMTTFVLDQ